MIIDITAMTNHQYVQFKLTEIRNESLIVKFIGMYFERKNYAQLLTEGLRSGA